METYAIDDTGRVFHWGESPPKPGINLAKCF
jgi:hypothetical protein